jgi:hypothetical protein
LAQHNRYLDYKLVLKMFPGNQAAQQGVGRAQKGLEFSQDWKWLNQQKSAPQSVVAPKFAPAPSSPVVTAKLPKAVGGGAAAIKTKSSPVANSAKAAEEGSKPTNGKKATAATTGNGGSTKLNSAALAYDELKAKGNKFVAARKFAEAAECYTRYGALLSLLANTP